MNSNNTKQIGNFSSQFFIPIKERWTQVASETEFNREASFAVQILHGNDYLKKVGKSNPNSLLKAVMNVANCGLTLNPVLAYSYLVPMGGEVVLMPSYKGICKLITDTGSVKSISSQLVYEGDEFDLVMGSEPSVNHKRKFKTKTVVGCYGIAHLKSGHQHIEFMDVEELDQIRDMSEQYKSYVKRGKKGSCIWVDHDGQMKRKTVIKRLSNQLPRTDEFERVANAIELDNAQYKVTNDQRYFIDTMFEQYPVPVEVEDRMRRELISCSSSRASEIIEELKEYKPKSLNERFNQEIVLANPSTPINKS
jgi:phage RecT family recombinase